MKTIKLLAVCCLTMCLFVACGKNSGNFQAGDNKNSGSFQEAIKAGDYETAHDTLDTYHNEYLEKLAEASTNFWRIRDMKPLQIKYYQSLEKLYKAEIAFLVDEGGTDATSRIVFLLNEINMDGQQPDEGLIDYYATCDNLEDGQLLYAYKQSVETYNRICNTALSLAVKSKNEDLAREIVELYKQNIEITRGDEPAIKIDGIRVDGNHGYVKYIDRDKEAAQEKYNKAVKSGAFKE